MHQGCPNKPIVLIWVCCSKTPPCRPWWDCHLGWEGHITPGSRAVSNASKQPPPYWCLAAVMPANKPTRRTANLLLVSNPGPNRTSLWGLRRGYRAWAIHGHTPSELPTDCTKGLSSILWGIGWYLSCSSSRGLVAYFVIHGCCVKRRVHQVMVMARAAAQWPPCITVPIPGTTHRTTCHNGEWWHRKKRTDMSGFLSGPCEGTPAGVESANTAGRLSRDPQGCPYWSHSGGIMFAAHTSSSPYPTQPKGPQK